MPVDPNAHDTALRLVAIADELLELAAATGHDIAAHRSSGTIATAMDVEEAPEQGAEAGQGEQAKELYRSRRQRDHIFDPLVIFGEPAWDILLDLFIAHVENREVSITSACIGAAVPVTTGLRWITVLEGEGLLARVHDPSDKRRSYIQLSPKGHAMMVRYLTAAAKPKAAVALRILSRSESALNASTTPAPDD